MNDIVEPYLRKASFLAGLTILLGLILSAVIFLSSNKVRVNAIDLVDQRIPVLISVKELMADLVEQERIIYEYYSDQNSEVFLDKTTQVKAKFIMHLGAIKTSGIFTEQLEIIVTQQEKIASLFEKFHQLMLVQNDNWDEMREVLSDISTTRRLLLPTLLKIEDITKQQVSQGHTSAMSQLNTTHWLVVVFAIILLFVAAFVSWYVRQYVVTQAKSTRLAMFSHANPNPIISVNNLGEIVFSNPACEKLLASIGLKPHEIERLLPDDFLGLRQTIAETVNYSITLEQKLKSKILQTNIYWHQALDAYDIHIHDITDRKLAEHKVHTLAFTSQETELANQYQLKNDLVPLIENDISFALAIVEIRHFSDKLGSLGLEATSALIRSVAKLIGKFLPEGVKLYHINQHQFSLILPLKIDSLSLQNIAKEITRAGNKSIVTAYGEFFVELDFGFSCFPIHGKIRDELIKNAHTALAISTLNTHENFTLFDYSQAEALDKSHQLIAKLRNAISLDELFLVFQPQLNLSTNKVIGLETLVRWRHQQELISPIDFIPLAEQSGLIVEIGHWILNQACHFTKRLVDQGYKDIVVAVNISPREFSHPQFCLDHRANARLSVRTFDRTSTHYFC